MARHACVSPCCPLQVEGAESQVLSDAFDWSAFTFLSLTVERPGAALRNRLRHHGYLYVGDHGCYGDQLWVPARERAERELACQSTVTHVLRSYRE